MRRRIQSVGGENGLFGVGGRGLEVGGGECLPEYLAGEEGDWLLLKMVEVADRTSGLQAKPFSNVQST